MVTRMTTLFVSQASTELLETSLSQTWNSFKWARWYDDDAIAVDQSPNTRRGDMKLLQSLCRTCNVFALCRAVIRSVLLSVRIFFEP